MSQKFNPFAARGAILKQAKKKREEGLPLTAREDALLKQWEAEQAAKNAPPVEASPPPPHNSTGAAIEFLRAEAGKVQSALSSMSASNPEYYPTARSLALLLSRLRDFERLPAGLREGGENVPRAAFEACLRVLGFAFDRAAEAGGQVALNDDQAASADAICAAVRAELRRGVAVLVESGVMAKWQAVELFAEQWEDVE